MNAEKIIRISLLWLQRTILPNSITPIEFSDAVDLYFGSISKSRKNQIRRLTNINWEQKHHLRLAIKDVHECSVKEQLKSADEYWDLIVEKNRERRLKAIGNISKAVWNSERLEK